MTDEVRPEWRPENFRATLEGDSAVVARARDEVAILAPLDIVPDPIPRMTHRDLEALMRLCWIRGFSAAKEDLKK
jgi:hypothetical protein